MTLASPEQPPVWTAPLVPVALALTAGVALDRFCIVPLPASLPLAVASMLAWFVCAAAFNKQWLALVSLWTSVAALGAAYHHWQRHHVDASDISRYAGREAIPARLRGNLHSAPIVQPGEGDDPLRSLPAEELSRFVLRVTRRQDLPSSTWHDVTGLAQVTAIGRIDDITVGDEIELLGRLALPGEAMNPGAFDYASFLRDHGVTVTVTRVKANEVTLTRRGWPTSLFGWLAVVRGWGQRTLARDFAGQDAIAAALLLGDGAGMTGDAWEGYLRTGVIHVLAISGQHLVVLAAFLWLFARFIGVRRRFAAPFVVLFLIVYALLTGGRPPVMRAAWTVLAYGGGTLLQRPVAHANTFALAWLGVALVNPMDIFNAGCQLSFLAVAVLMWGVARWSEQPIDPLQQAIDEARPWPFAAVVWLWRKTLTFYALNAAVWLAVAPLVASHYHLVSPISLLIGPPMVMLTSLALLAGFGFLLFAGWCPPLAWLFACGTQLSLQGCETLVSLGQHIPGAYFFVADVPSWWVWTVNIGLLLGLTLPIVRRHGRSAVAVGLAWLALGILLQLVPHRPGEMRCTFVAVGHGGCTVIETPAGRVIVYDAGATTGPDVTRRHIAPFLWSRGIRRIDDLILSHADLDHFNGVPQLADRFAIGRVIATPTFARRDSAGLKKTLASLEARAIPIEIVHAGQRWSADGISFQVLHPPENFRAEKENARSLVLHVISGDWSLLLTGDLEEAGLTRVLHMPAPRIDLLMAPHHGSDKSNIPAFAAWARPKLVVSCQTEPLNERDSVKMYEKLRIPFWGTWPHGMVTIRQRDGRTWAETYQTRLRHEFE